MGEEPDAAKSRPRYALAGGRPGWDFSGLTREDQPDGYTVFRDAKGECKSIVMTCLLVEVD